MPKKAKKPAKKVVVKKKTATQKFNSLPRAKKRVKVAQDVIKQLTQKKLIAQKGSYINIAQAELENEKIDIKANYEKVSRCRVCALGACLMSATKFGNILQFSDIGSSIGNLKNPKVKKLLNSIFTAHQLLLIENAFEGYYSGADRVGTDVLKGNDLSYRERDACDKFFYKYSTPKGRLIGIMQNIIENKGTFTL